MINIFITLAKQYPNDMELGKHLRDITNLGKYISNDQELGAYIRKQIINYGSNK